MVWFLKGGCVAGMRRGYACRDEEGTEGWCVGGEGVDERGEAVCVRECCVSV